MQKDYVVKTDEREGKLIYDISSVSNGVSLFKCYLHDEILDDMPQIHIETLTDVYDGPIQYLLTK